MMNLKTSEILSRLSVMTPEDEVVYQAERVREARRCGDKAQIIADVLTDDGQDFLKIPPRYRGAECCDFSASTRADMESFIGRKIKLLTMTGPVGAGKTRALYALYRSILREGRKCKVFTVPVLVRELQALAVRGGGQDLDVLRDIYEAPYAVLLDDLGVEKPTEFTVNTIDILIGEREKWDRATAITSNLKLREIAEKFDRRIADRLAGGTVLEFRGKSKRLK